MIDLNTIIKLPGGELRRQNNIGLIFDSFMGANSGKMGILRTLGEGLIQNFDSYELSPKCSIRFLTAEVHANKPVLFTLKSEKILVSYAGLNNKIDSCVQLDLGPGQKFTVWCYGTGEDTRASLILNGLIRIPVA